MADNPQALPQAQQTVPQDAPLPARTPPLDFAWLPKSMQDHPHTAMLLQVLNEAADGDLDILPSDTAMMLVFALENLDVDDSEVDDAEDKPSATAAEPDVQTKNDTASTTQKVLSLIGPAGLDELDELGAAGLIAAADEVEDFQRYVRRGKSAERFTARAIPLGVFAVLKNAVAQEGPKALNGVRRRLMDRAAQLTD